jgi:hypothetical protein
MNALAPSSTAPKQEYKLNRHHGIARRIATYLHWCASEQPGKFIPYADIAHRVLGLKTPLNEQSKLAHVVRDELHRVRDLAMNLFGKDILTNGSGARATVDSEEVFRYRLGRELSRLIDQVRRYERLAELIDMTGAGRLPDDMRRYASHTLSFAIGLDENLRARLKEWTALTERPAPPCIENPEGRPRPLDS